MSNLMNHCRWIVAIGLGCVVTMPVSAETIVPSALTLPLQVADLLQKMVATAAILVTAWWAYFRFVRFRTLEKRVEFSFNWKTAPLTHAQLLGMGPRLLGILTIKLTNRGSTLVELRKDDEYRCTLGVGLIAPPRNVERIAYANRRNGDLDPLPFLFKSHKRIEPGETIDDVAVVFVDVLDAVAIQFNVQVQTLGPRGKREALMSSTVAFAIASGPVDASACSEDEQDDYDEVAEVRNFLFGWMGEAKAILATALAPDAESELSELLKEAYLLLPTLVTDVKQEPLDRARECAGRLKTFVKQHAR